jgi:hypothetical protein
LGLTALKATSNGVKSEGLSFFIRQELQVDALAGESLKETAALAMWLIDYVICEGPFTSSGSFDGLDGEFLTVELSDLRRLATVRRSA